MTDAHIDKMKAQLKQLEGQLQEASADVRINIQNKIDEIKKKMQEDD
ncbi:MAG TPA: hypothetical protein PLS49_07170 [Candidatus Woesebacteria bacterium]|nr:hypothetical protein [Candidatus Woesebacteria bacterium]